MSSPDSQNAPGSSEDTPRLPSFPPTSEQVQRPQIPQPRSGANRPQGFFPFAGFPAFVAPPAGRLPLALNAPHQQTAAPSAGAAAQHPSNATPPNVDFAALLPQMLFAFAAGQQIAAHKPQTPAVGGGGGGASGSSAPASVTTSTTVAPPSLPFTSNLLAAAASSMSQDSKKSRGRPKREIASMGGSGGSGEASSDLDPQRKIRKIDPQVAPKVSPKYSHLTQWLESFTMFKSDAIPITKNLLYELYLHTAQFHVIDQRYGDQYNFAFGTARAVASKLLGARQSASATIQSTPLDCRPVSEIREFSVRLLTASGHPQLDSESEQLEHVWNYLLTKKYIFGVEILAEKVPDEFKKREIWIEHEKLQDVMKTFTVDAKKQQVPVVPLSHVDHVLWNEQDMVVYRLMIGDAEVSECKSVENRIAIHCVKPPISFPTFSSSSPSSSLSTAQQKAPAAVADQNPMSSPMTSFLSAPDSVLHSSGFHPPTALFPPLSVQQPEQQTNVGGSIISGIPALSRPPDGGRSPYPLEGPFIILSSGLGFDVKEILMKEDKGHVWLYIRKAEAKGSVTATRL